MSQSKLRFGILGTGNIARQFADGMRGAEQSIVVAAGSRAQQTAQSFTEQYAIPTAHGSYDALIKDESVDAVYVSLPNSMHKEWTIRALEAGKHVLCEKPLAGNLKDAIEMFDTARRCGRLLVEAFMYRSHPLTHKVLEQVQGGAIGKIKLIRTSFCFSTRKIDGNTRFSPELAGGAIMDIGCYCVDFAQLMAGETPRAVKCIGNIHPTGVDEYAAGTLTFDSGVVSLFSCGMTVQADNAALICGDKGYLRVPVPWKPPVKGAVFEIDGLPAPKQDKSDRPVPQKQVVRVDAHGTLYGMEADDFAQAVHGQKKPAVTEEQSLLVMRMLDQMRQQIGLSY